MLQGRGIYLEGVEKSISHDGALCDRARAYDAGNYAYSVAFIMCYQKATGKARKAMTFLYFTFPGLLNWDQIN